MVRLQLESLPGEFEGQGELLVEHADSGGEPGDEPVGGREGERFLEAIVRPSFTAGEQDVTSGEPEVGSVATFGDAGIGEADRAFHVAVAGEGNRVGGEP